MTSFPSKNKNEKGGSGPNKTLRGERGTWGAAAIFRAPSVWRPGGFGGFGVLVKLKLCVVRVWVFCVCVFVCVSVCLCVCVFVCFFAVCVGAHRAPLGPFALPVLTKTLIFQHIFCHPVVKCQPMTTITLKKQGQRKGKQQQPNPPKTTKNCPTCKKMTKKSSEVGPETPETEPTGRQGEANLRPRRHREQQNKHQNTPEDKQKGNTQPKMTESVKKYANSGRPKFQFYMTFQGIFVFAIT